MGNMKKGGTGNLKGNRCNLGNLGNLTKRWHGESGESGRESGESDKKGDMGNLAKRKHGEFREYCNACTLKCSKKGAPSPWHWCRGARPVNLATL